MPSGRRCAGGHGLGALAGDHLEPEVGEPLGEQALRGADHEDRLLEPALPADEADLLAAVLGVVAGVGLVGDEVGERGGEHRQVGVDHDPAAQVAEVVVEARPRLVGDEVEVDVLALGQAEEPVGALAEVLGERVDGRAQLLDGHGLRLAPGDEALGERARAGQDLVEGAVGLLEDRLVDLAGPDAVAALDLVGERDVDPRQLLGRGVQADDLGPQPAAPVGLVAHAGRLLVDGCAGVEVGDEPRGRRRRWPPGRPRARPQMRSRSSGGP